MPPEAFERWLSEMGLSKGEAAELLGIHRNTVSRFMKRGGPAYLALACTALFHRLENRY